MRFVSLVLAVVLAACDSAEVRTACPDPFAVNLSDGEAALVRKSTFLSVNCPPVVEGTALVSEATVSIETVLDTLQLRFDEGGSRAQAEYVRGDDGERAGPYDRRTVSAVLSASWEADTGRGLFSVVVFNNSLFPVSDTLRGHFHARSRSGA